jgi:two-component system, OmpR family, response regulator
MLPSVSVPSEDVIHFLVIDDDKHRCEHLSQYLKGHGFVLHKGFDHPEMPNSSKPETIDLIIARDTLWDKGIRNAIKSEFKSLPPVILILTTTEGSDTLSSHGPNIEAYLNEPFSAHDLLASIQTILRRKKLQRRPVNSLVTEFFGWRLEHETRSLLREGKAPDILSRSEYELLKLLMRRPGRALSRDQILDTIYGPKYRNFGRAIDVQISRLRRKLKIEGEEDIIRTIRGLGYMFRPDNQ